MEIFYNITMLFLGLILMYSLLSNLAILVAYFCQQSKNERTYKFGFGVMSEFLPNLITDKAKCSSYKNCVKCIHIHCPNSIRYKKEFDRITDNDTRYDY